MRPGAHTAFGLDRNEYERARMHLPRILGFNRAHPDQNVAVEEADYGIQWSMFFSDPDNNTLELTTWEVEDAPKSGKPTGHN